MSELILALDFGDHFTALMSHRDINGLPDGFHATTYLAGNNIGVLPIRVKRRRRHEDK